MTSKVYFELGTVKKAHAQGLSDSASTQCGKPDLDCSRFGILVTLLEFALAHNRT